MATATSTVTSDRHCTRADPPAVASPKAVPRSSSFTRSRRFLTGKGLSARESFGVVDESTTRHMFQAARMQLMDMLETESNTPPPPPSVSSKSLPRASSAHIPPAPPLPWGKRNGITRAASHGSVVRNVNSKGVGGVCSEVRFKSVADGRKWFENFEAADSTAEVSASSAVSDNNVGMSKARVHNDGIAEKYAHEKQRRKQGSSGADDASSLESANENALKRVAVVTMPESESVTPCSSDAPLSPYVPCALPSDRFCVSARGFLEDGVVTDVDADCAKVARRDSHAAYVANVLGDQHVDEDEQVINVDDDARVAGDRETRRIEMHEKKLSGLTRIHEFGNSVKRKLPRAGSFSRVARSRSVGRVGRLRSFGRKEVITQEQQAHASACSAMRTPKRKQRLGKQSETQLAPHDKRGEHEDSGALLRS
ncbi:unnamed protein product, partial [Agarophyton chilense]